MIAIFHIKHDDVVVGLVKVELDRHYMIEVAKDALSENRPIAGKEWLEYLQEAVAVDHHVDVTFVDFYETWRAAESEELALYEKALDADIPRRPGPTGQTVLQGFEPDVEEDPEAEIKRKMLEGLEP